MFDLQLAREVRRLAPNAFLWADANGGYDLPTALEMAPKLAEVGVDVLESPIRPNHLSGYQALKRQAALPILMDEGIVSPVELREFIQLKMLDGISVKPSRCGGLLSNQQQIELIEEHGLMWLGSGLSDPDIALAASLGLYGCVWTEEACRAERSAVPDRRCAEDSDAHRRWRGCCAARPRTGCGSR